MFLCIIIIIINLLGITLGENWDYEHQDEWPGLCQTGKRQSPINIITDKLAKFPLNEIEYVGYDKAYDLTVTNMGFTVQFAPKSEEKPIIRGPLLGSDYILGQFHFHWSSEHKIDGHRYDLEAHFVHYNQKYANISEAKDQKKGLAYIAVLYEISRGGNEHFDKIIKGMSEVQEFSATYQIDEFTMSSIFPNDKKPYYTYTGSNSVPDCEEDAIWIIIKNQAPISKEHMDQFPKIKDAKGNNLRRNYRETQDTNGRGVFVYNPK